MEIKWLSDKEKKLSIDIEGLKASIHLKKGESVEFPDSFKNQIQKIFSDPISCGYCTIEASQSKAKAKAEGFYPRKENKEEI